jgi:hypothetical protein
MTLSKKTLVDGIEVESNRAVKVRTKTVITENDTPISASYQSHVILPGDDYGSEEAIVRDICKALHTAEAVEAYKAK